MAEQRVSFMRGDSSTIPNTHVAGRFLIETDTGNAYLDISNSERVSLTNTHNVEALQTQITENATKWKAFTD